jgi:hypothetical protein
MITIKKEREITMCTRKKIIPFNPLYISPLRQSEKQRASSEYAERRWLRPVQLSNYNLKSRGTYSDQVRDNMRMMRTVNLNKFNDIKDYTTTVHEVYKKAA